MFRLFVAIRPPAPLRAQLLALMGGVEGARWQDDGQLHLTLRFIGDVPGDVADDVAVALAGVSNPPVSLGLSGAGTFDKGGKIHTLWAGIARDAGLASLQKKIDRAIHHAGVADDARAWMPHITLARGRMGADARAFAAMHSGLKSDAHRIDAFGLFESSLGTQGAHYTLIERYPLNRVSSPATSA